MINKFKKSDNKNCLSRRNFVKLGSAAIVVTGLKLPNTGGILPDNNEAPGIKKTKVLGRTGFKASDISMGTTRVKEANVIRYAYDKGVNYFDTAEGYGGGESEKLIGQNMQFMDRKNIFITSKIHINEDESTDSILDRFKKCQERLKTDYIDAFYIHNPSSVELLNHKSFHAATKQLKADGRLKFIGVSSHGSRRGRDDSMETILSAAAEDGRFDMMLLIYNFMNKETGDKILQLCKKHNMGTTAMKTAPGVLKLEEIDPDNLTKDQEEYVQRRMKRGASKEEAIERLKKSAERQAETFEKTQPFLEKYSIKTRESLKLKSVQWVIQNTDIHTACVSFSDFELIDNVIPLSGTRLSASDIEFLDTCKLAFNSQYCRHGCKECVQRCPHELPVSSIMRYAYYFESQSREKYAMEKYAGLSSGNGYFCTDCNAPCEAACPYHLDVQAHMLRAHSLLTLG